MAMAWPTILMVAQATTTGVPRASAATAPMVMARERLSLSQAMVMVDMDLPQCM